MARPKLSACDKTNVRKIRGKSFDFLMPAQAFVFSFAFLHVWPEWAMPQSPIDRLAAPCSTILKNRLFEKGGTIMETSPSSQSTTAEEAQAIAQEAYVYLYPLVLMDITRKQLINLDPKTSPLGG